MNDKECIDWRIAAKLILGKDIPPAFPGGPSHKAGAPIYLSHFIKSKEFRYLGFITPSVIAMSFNIAIHASEKAFELKEKFMFEDIVGPKGNYKGITKSITPVLFDYFENCMISVSFSFQAIEVFCNSMISKDENRIFSITRKGKQADKRGYEVERDFSTEEKLDEILPEILNDKIPKQEKLWQEFKNLKFIRDSTIHLKSIDMHSKIENADKETLFYYFLEKNPFEYPKISYKVINFFEKNSSPWEEHVRESITKFTKF